VFAKFLAFRLGKTDKNVCPTNAAFKASFDLAFFGGRAGLIRTSE